MILSNTLNNVLTLQLCVLYSLSAFILKTWRTGILPFPVTCCFILCNNSDSYLCDELCKVVQTVILLMLLTLKHWKSLSVRKKKSTLTETSSFAHKHFTCWISFVVFFFWSHSLWSSIQVVRSETLAPVFLSVKLSAARWLIFMVLLCHWLTFLWCC